MRIENHPILMQEKGKNQINFVFNGENVTGFLGDTIASALYAMGIKQLSTSIHRKRPRGLYCAIGNCSSCHMIVDGVPNVKTCITLLKEGMIVSSQENKGEINVV